MTTTYTVTGRWPLPLDMLRYDEAKPATPHDAALVTSFSNPDRSPCEVAGAQEREVTITLVSGRQPFFLATSCAERWRSYGWRSSLDTTAQQHPKARVRSAAPVPKRTVEPSSAGMFMVVEEDGTEDGRLVADDLTEPSARELAAAPQALAALRLALPYLAGDVNDPEGPVSVVAKAIAAFTPTI